MPSIKILFFAAARELAGGVQQVMADVVPAADGDGVLRLGDVRAYLAKTFPGISPISHMLLNRGHNVAWQTVEMTFAPSCMRDTPPLTCIRHG